MSAVKKPKVKIAKVTRKGTRGQMGSHRAKVAEWAPSARQWEIYEAVARGGSYRHVGAAFSMTFQNVAQLCIKVDAVLSQMFIDRVRQIRQRHTSQLEHLYCEMMSAWDDSRATVTTGEGKDAKTVRKPGVTSFASEARAILADIRKIHAADKNPKIDELAAGDTGERFAGRKREDVIQERINMLNASLTASKAISGIGTKTGDE